MLLHRFTNGDTILRENNSIIAHFAGSRKILSSAPHNGGLRTNLKYAFNHCAERTEDAMRGSTYAEHIRILSSELGLDSDLSCGISTGAYAENVAIVSKKYRNTEVTAVVTAGIDVNGGRAGDPANWHEADTGYIHIPGTINIMLFFNNNLTDGAICRALITCTEAKSAAVSELAVPSCYSNSLATGSGTDGVIIVSDQSDKLTLTDAGNHFKLGELIGQAVKSAVKEALFLETQLCPQRQFDFFRRLSRYGISEKTLNTRFILQSSSDGIAISENLGSKTKALNIFPDELNKLINKREVIMMSILYAHMLDQLSWHLITCEDAVQVVSLLLNKYLNYKLATSNNMVYKNIDSCIIFLTEALEKAICRCISDHLNSKPLVKI